MEQQSQTHMSILDLNIDCLMHMRSYLNFCDKMRFALACDRFDHINGEINFEIHDWTKFICSFKATEVDTILSKIGSDLKKISYIMEQNNYLSHLKAFGSLVKKFCKNAELKLTWSRYKTVFDSIYVHNSNEDEASRYISSLSQITTLDLRDNNTITGRYLNELKNLKTLSLQNCRIFESSHFIEICKANQLKNLDIFDCIKLNDAAIETIVRTQTELETITIGGISATNIGNVGRLKKLKRLEMHDKGCLAILTEAVQQQPVCLEEVLIFEPEECEIIEIRQKLLDLRYLKKLSLAMNIPNDDFLIRIAQNCSRLEELHIPRALNITDRGIIGAVQNSNLKCLDLTNCTQFNEDIYRKIVSVRRNNKSNRLKINSTSSEIKKDFLLTKEHLANKDLIAMNIC